MQSRVPDKHILFLESKTESSSLSRLWDGAATETATDISLSGTFRRDWRWDLRRDPAMREKDRRRRRERVAWKETKDKMGIREGKDSNRRWVVAIKIIALSAHKFGVVVCLLRNYTVRKIEENHFIFHFKLFIE